MSDTPRGRTRVDPSASLPITVANVRDWFPAPTTENPFASDPWWQVQALGLLAAVQFLRLLPAGDLQQQALVELRRGIDTGLLALKPPPDEEIERRLAQTLAPWCPSPFNVVDAMLDTADVQPGERVLDLGSGDGRIVFEAARRGAIATGIDIDGQFIAQACERSAEHPSYRTASFIHGRIEDVDWGTPDVVTCYLLSSSMETLAEKFRQLPPKTRIISHAFLIPGWEPTRSVLVGDAWIHLWIVERGD